MVRVGFRQWRPPGQPSVVELWKEGRKCTLHIIVPLYFVLFTLAHLVVFCFVVFGGFFRGGGGRAVGPGELLRITPPPPPPPSGHSLGFLLVVVFTWEEFCTTNAVLIRTKKGTKSKKDRTFWWTGSFSTHDPSVVAGTRITAVYVREGLLVSVKRLSRCVIATLNS